MATTSAKLILPPALGSYAFLFKPRLQKGGKEPKYSICLIWPVAQKDKLQPLLAAVASACLEKFGPNSLELLKAGKVLKNPIHYGNVDKDITDPKNAAVYKDTIYVNCNNARQPGIVDAKLQKVFEDTECYSGCTFRASVSVYAFDKEGGKGVGIGLNNIQVVSKGPRLDNHADAEQDFKEFQDAPATGAGDLL